MTESLSSCCLHSRERQTISKKEQKIRRVKGQCGPVLLRMTRAGEGRGRTGVQQLKQEGMEAFAEKMAFLKSFQGKEGKSRRDV